MKYTKALVHGDGQKQNKTKKSNWALYHRQFSLAIRLVRPWPKSFRTQSTYYNTILKRWTCPYKTYILGNNSDIMQISCLLRLSSHCETHRVSLAHPSAQLDRATWGLTERTHAHPWDHYQLSEFPVCVPLKVVLGYPFTL